MLYFKRNNRGSDGEKVSLRGVYWLFGMVALTVAVTLLYRTLMEQPYFRVVLIVYMAITAASILGYVIYNRGFSRRGVTEEMLPSDWSAEKKAAFVEDGKVRLRRSRWLLVIAFAFFFTFAMDAFLLFVVPLFEQMLKG